MKKRERGRATVPFSLHIHTHMTYFDRFIYAAPRLHKELQRDKQGNLTGTKSVARWEYAPDVLTDTFIRKLKKTIRPEGERFEDYLRHLPNFDEFASTDDTIILPRWQAVALLLDRLAGIYWDITKSIKKCTDADTLPQMQCLKGVFEECIGEITTIIERTDTKIPEQYLEEELICDLPFIGLIPHQNIKVWWTNDGEDRDVSIRTPKANVFPGSEAPASATPTSEQSTASPTSAPTDAPKQPTYGGNGKPKDLYTVEEVMAMLGVSRNTLWRWHKRSDYFHPIRIGGKSRYRRMDVERMLKEGK